MPFRIRIPSCAIAFVALLAATADAAPSNARAVEFYNLDLQHYFITADAGEAVGIDSGTAGAGWVRTGRSFAVWSDSTEAGVVPVCRFYSSAARSHFFTASAAECDSLKALEAQQRSAAAAAGRMFGGWAFEGIAFGAQATSAGRCAGASEPIARVYNNGAATGEGSNHRYVSDPALASMMVERGWSAEGVAFCAPTDALSGTSAPALPVTTVFPELAATWTGTAQWHALSRNGSGAPEQSHARDDLSLTIAADGTLTGNGNGCTLTGTIAVGDGFHSLFTGSLTLAGCTDPAFNGTHELQIERAGPSRIVVHFGTRTADGFINVVGVLGSDAPPPGPTTPGTHALQLPGTWAGDVNWLSVVHTGSGAPVDGANPEKHTLELTFDAAGGITGSGFGCAFTGTWTAADRGAKFTVTLSASGCTNAAFDGDYNDVNIGGMAGEATLGFETHRTTTDAGTTTRVLIAGALHKQ